MRRRELLKKGAYAATLVALPISSSPSSVQPLPNEALFRQAPDTYWLRDPPKTVSSTGLAGFPKHGWTGRCA